jgi:hypothetical protein
MKYLFFTMLVIIVACISGCNKGADSSSGFSLPEGNAEQGKLVLEKYLCLSCHVVADVEPVSGLIGNPNFSIRLGGKSPKVKTYADLLTSVINPSHKFAVGYALKDVQSDGVSKMLIYNDVMTVTELVDLVTFLQGKYELVPYNRSNYQYYGY